MASRFTTWTALLLFTLAPGFAQKKKNTKIAPPASSTPAPQKLDEEYTKLIKQYLQGPAHHHRTGGPHARVRYRAFAAEILRAHPRHTRRADLRQGHRALLRSARASLAAREVLEDRAVRRRPRPGRAGHRRRSRPSRTSTNTKTMLAALGDPRKTTEAQAQRADPHRASRFTGSTAASIRPKPADRKC